MRWHSGVVYPGLGDGAKKDGHKIDEDPDSSDDGALAGGPCSHLAQ